MELPVFWALSDEGSECLLYIVIKRENWRPVERGLRVLMFVSFREVI